jgi:hypothetical protein
MNETAKVCEHERARFARVLTAGVNSTKMQTYSSWILETYTTVRDISTSPSLFYTPRLGTGLSDGFPPGGWDGEDVSRIFLLSS